MAGVDGPVEPILRGCRERIDRAADGDGRGNLLAVIQVLIGLRYDDPRFLAMFGGEGAMIESPVLQRFAANQERKGMVKLLTKMLERRFGIIPEDLIAALRTIQDETTLIQLSESADRCPDLAAFRAELSTAANRPAMSEETLP